MTNAEENKTIKIYSFYYKETEIPISNETYIPVMAGNNLRTLSADFIGDDSGQSITERNNYYSELTGLFWVWKNTKQDIVGSCHYRRYFTAKKYPLGYQVKRFLLSHTWFFKKRKGVIYTQKINKFRSRILTESEIAELMQHCDIILPKKREFRYSIKEHYRKYHNITDLKIIEDIIKSKYPDYLNSFHNTLNNNLLYVNNMFITSSILFNQLMEWLFTILFEFESRVDIQNYVDYQRRVFGFLSERLITVWINHQDLKIKELPIIYFKKLKYTN